MYPEEPFLPRAPDPEEIILGETEAEPEPEEEEEKLAEEEEKQTEEASSLEDKEEPVNE